MVEKERMVIIGGGGHSKSVLDTLSDTDIYSIEGILDSGVMVGTSIMGYRVLGDDNKLKELFEQGCRLAALAIGDNRIRHKLFDKLKTIGFRLPPIVDKTAIVSMSSILEEGVFIGKNTVVNAESSIGKGTIINSGAIVEHECVVDSFVHIAPGTILCGQVTVGESSFVGAGSVVKQGIHIGEHSVIGMGSVVISDIQSKVMAYGNPCKEVKKWFI